jgi:hypothetical protein
MLVPPNNVIVIFGDGIPSMARGHALLELEKYLRREWKLDAEVFMETMADDSKLRRAMTPEQREKL